MEWCIGGLVSGGGQERSGLLRGVGFPLGESESGSLVEGAPAPAPTHAGVGS